jgi:hypothetical protein
LLCNIFVDKDMEDAYNSDGIQLLAGMKISKCNSS